MTTPEQTESTASVPTPLELMQRSQNHDNVTKIGSKVYTSITIEEGSLKPGSYALGDILDEKSRGRLDEIKQQLMREAEEKFGRELTTEAAITYDHLKLLEERGFSTDTYVVTDFDEDEVEIDPNSSDELSVSNNGTQSRHTKYITALYTNAETGEVESAVSYPVPYEHGNGILIAREDGSGNLHEVAEFLGDKGVTKQMYRELTDAVRVNHVGMPEEVDSRVAENLQMPINTFADENARANHMKRAKRRQ